MGYGESMLEKDNLDGLVPQAKMKKLCLQDREGSPEGAKNAKDVSMAEP